MDRINCPNAAILFPGLTRDAFSGAPAAAPVPGILTLSLPRAVRCLL